MNRVWGEMKLKKLCYFNVYPMQSYYFIAVNPNYFRAGI